MRKAFLFLLLLFCNVVFSQYIKGKVVDAQNLPLVAANVYYEGTTLSTITNDKGEFALLFEPKLNRPLVVSFIGYVTFYIDNYTPSESLLITLTEEVNSLKEVVVKKDKFSRKEKMAIFKENFLGITPFGLKTIIQNEDDIVLEYDEKTFMLKAYCYKPLLIINPSLGYKITYEMVDFEIQFSYLSVHRNAVTRSYYAGFSRYEEIENTSKVIRKRVKAYEGSPLHFFRNLINEVWGKDNFVLFDKGYATNASDHFTVTNEGDKYKVTIKKQKMDFKNSTVTAVFSLLFKNKDQSAVQFNTETIYVDPFGNNLSLRDVFLSGAIQLKRLGDTLPLNYEVK